MYHYPGRSIRKYIFRFLLRLFTISLEDLSESISSVSVWHCVPFLWIKISESISSVCFWHCVPFLWKIYQKVYLSFLIGIVYHLPSRTIRKVIFRFLLGLCTISLEDLLQSIYFHFLFELCTISLEDLSESISCDSYWDWLPFLSKIYQKICPSFLIDILYYFSERSIKKCVFRFSLEFCLIFLDSLSERKSSLFYWNCLTVFSKIYQKLYLLFVTGIVHDYFGRSGRKYIFRFLLGLCTISLEDVSETNSFVYFWHSVPFLWMFYQEVYLPLLIVIV